MITEEIKRVLDYLSDCILEQRQALELHDRLLHLLCDKHPEFHDDIKNIVAQMVAEAGSESIITTGEETK